MQLYSPPYWAAFTFITLAYVVCHILVAFVISPIQAAFLGEITAYASLVHLPHGVRILATMFFGWKAIAPLITGNVIGLYFSAGEAFSPVPASLMLQSIVAAGSSAFIAFELFKFFGRNCYSVGAKIPIWTQIVFVGILASAINSAAQVFVFRNLHEIDAFDTAPLVFAAGDVIGLLVLLFALMFTFRWLRLANRMSP